jgi:uncharacterized OB-fold protein
MLWSCKTCGTKYAPELPKCPSCGSTSYAEAPGEAQVAEPVVDTPKPAMSAGGARPAVSPGGAAPMSNPAKPVGP